MHREQDIIAWATERGIFSELHGSNPTRQADKTQEELLEMFDGIRRGDLGLIQDAIGDICVTLAIQCKFWGLSMDDCIEAAWNEIKDRKGQMIAGQFVKERNSIDDASPEEWDAVRAGIVEAKGSN